MSSSLPDFPALSKHDYDSMLVNMKSNTTADFKKRNDLNAFIRCVSLSQSIHKLMNTMVENGVPKASLVRGSAATSWWDGPIYADGCTSILYKRFGSKGLKVGTERWNENDPLSRADVVIDPTLESYTITLE